MVTADHRNLDKEMEARAELFVETSNELKAPFDESEVKTLKQSWGEVKYITARMVMDRLDDVLTPVGWTDRYVEMSDGSVQCSLSVYFLGWGWLTRCDVGSPQGSEPMKAAYSDALKRAAVKFGIGRYLYADAPSQPSQPSQPQPEPKNWAPEPPPTDSPVSEVPLCINHQKPMRRVTGNGANGPYDFWGCSEKGTGQGYKANGYCAYTEEPVQKL